MHIQFIFDCLLSLFAFRAYWGKNKYTQKKRRPESRQKVYFINYFLVKNSVMARIM